mmetsp:Transcript_7609/g.16514  ORF Transcript_7609/g.16514 Transcript_7609/m.16514 type:complete len:344 (-) Transcript_7609:559-1590(-)
MTSYHELSEATNVLESPTSTSLYSRVDDIYDQLRTMRYQEQTTYKCVDYIGLQRHTDIQTRLTSVSFESRNSLTKTEEVSEIWREKICEWSYEVVDHFDMSREVVAVSLNLLDRFLAKVTCKKKEFQLAAMAALNIAIKLLERRPLKLKTFVELSRGSFTIENLISYERYVLQVLSWHVHTPTSLSFAQNFMYLLPPSISESTRNDITDFTQFLLELSVCDYSLVPCPPSFLAFAAMLNAIDDVGSDRFSPCEQAIFSKNLSLIGLEFSSEVSKVKERLRQIYRDSAGFGSEQFASREVNSPVCVSEVGQGESETSVHATAHSKNTSSERQSRKARKTNLSCT